MPMGGEMGLTGAGGLGACTSGAFGGAALGASLLWNLWAAETTKFQLQVPGPTVVGGVRTAPEAVPVT